MTPSKSMLRTLGAFALVASYTATIGLAHASPEAGHGDGHGGGITWISPIVTPEGNVGFVWTLINFAVLLWILEKLLFSKLRARQREKHDTVKTELDKATAARTEAESIIAEYKGRLERLDAEVEEITAEARRKAEADRAKIIEGAQKEAERIKASATMAAEREAEARRRQIENEIVDRAIEQAETLLRQRIGSTDQRRMVDDYVGSLAQVNFGGKQ